MLLWVVHGESQPDVRVGVGELSIGAVIHDSLSFVVDISPASIYEEVSPICRLQFGLRAIA